MCVVGHTGEKICNNIWTKFVGPYRFNNPSWDTLPNLPNPPENVSQILLALALLAHTVKTTWFSGWLMAKHSLIHWAINSQRATKTHVFHHIWPVRVVGHIFTGCPKKNATTYISLDFRENRKPLFIIYTLLESYISHLSTMKKSQWNDIPVGRYPPKHDTPSDVKSRATGTCLLLHKLAPCVKQSPGLLVKMQRDDQSIMSKITCSEFPFWIIWVERLPDHWTVPS